MAAQTKTAPRHYPYVTRVLLDLFDRGALSRVVAVTVEPEYGYATQITYSSGSTRMTYGNDVGLNAAASCNAVNDKAYAKFFLQARDVRCPKGAAFLLPWWAERIGRRMAFADVTDLRVSTSAVEFVDEHIGLPVFVKPVDGSKGVGVWRCDTPGQILAALDAFAAGRVRVALVEEAVDLPDFRLVVLRGQVISAYRRVPLTVVGDGRATVVELAERLQVEFSRTGRDSVLDLGDRRIDTCLARNGIRRDTVPGPGQVVRLHDISNLSTGGTAEDVTDVVAQRWRTLARDVTASFRLTFAGVDLACSDIRSDDAAHSVLEINAAPGLDHYAATGAEQQQTVRDLYARVLNLDPGLPS